MKRDEGPLAEQIPFLPSATTCPFVSSRICAMPLGVPGLVNDPRFYCQGLGDWQEANRAAKAKKEREARKWAQLEQQQATISSGSLDQNPPPLPPPANVRRSLSSLHPLPGRGASARLIQHPNQLPHQIESSTTSEQTFLVLPTRVMMQQDGPYVLPAWNDLATLPRTSSRVVLVPSRSREK